MTIRFQILLNYCFDFCCCGDLVFVEVSQYISEKNSRLNAPLEGFNLFFFFILIGIFSCRSLAFIATSLLI